VKYCTQLNKKAKKGKKMKAYIYNTETRNVVAEIKGDDNKSIEAKFDELNYDSDEFGLTYSPAFGADDGLITDGDFEVIDVRG
jgi:hypothetical protein